MTSASVSEREGAAGGAELVLELDVVLDDPVDDDVHAVVAVKVRVGVLLAHTAVRRPARVSDAGRGGPLGERDGTAGRRRVAVASFARSASRLPTARMASICSPARTEIPAES